MRYGKARPVQAKYGNTKIWQLGNKQSLAQPQSQASGTAIRLTGPRKQGATWAYWTLNKCSAIAQLKHSMIPAGDGYQPVRTLYTAMV